MPGIFYRPVDRRGFLKTTLLGGAVVSVLGLPRARGADTKELRLALLSDTHIPGDRVNGHRGFNPWKHLEQIVPDIVAARPEGAILCGDVARLEGKVEDYQEVKALLEPLAKQAPIYIGLGNHDDRANFLKVFLDPPGVHPKIQDRFVTVIEHELVRIIVLDSLLYPNKVAGLLGRSQRQWLAENLPRFADRPVVLFVHHTLEDGDGDLLDVDRLFSLARAHRQVKALGYGHSHVWELGERDGVKLINLPAVGYNFRDQDPVGWVEARFRADGVALTLRAFAGNRAEDGKTTLVQWG